MLHQIDSGLYHRQGSAPTNFARTLPSPQSELAQQIVKDPYSFEFLDIAAEAHERDLERALTTPRSEMLFELADVLGPHDVLYTADPFMLDGRSWADRADAIIKELKRER